ncbi:hypothetical protein PFISCL1PPCAC_3188, partial [Pristionchus fissidentatus]
IIEDLGPHVEKWVLSMQGLWPFVGTRYSMRVLGGSASLKHPDLKNIGLEPFGRTAKNMSKITVGKYNETARLVRDQFRMRGPESNEYQVIVAEAKRRDSFWAMQSIDNSTFPECEKYENFTHNIKEELCSIPHS